MRMTTITVLIQLAFNNKGKTVYLNSIWNWKKPILLLSDYMIGFRKENPKNSSDNFYI